MGLPHLHIYLCTQTLCKIIFISFINRYRNIISRRKVIKINKFNYQTSIIEYSLKTAFIKKIIDFNIDL